MFPGTLIYNSIGSEGIPAPLGFLYKKRLSQPADLRVFIPNRN